MNSDLLEPERLIVFRKTHYTWTDPWGRKHTEPTLEVRAILRPKTDASIRRFDFTADPGYGPDNCYTSFGYHIPMIGNVRKLRNVVDYTGGSWWSVPAGVDLVLHDKSTWKNESRRAINMWGRPTANPFPEAKS